jgi:phosphate transport system substrate-binding protein
VLYGAGTDSGTFDYFTEAINGEAGAIRTDFFPSEDDNVLVQGVEGDKNAMGFFGYAYYVGDADRLKALEIDGGNGCVAPSNEAIENNTYTPLSRPLFLYINKAVTDENPDLVAFVEFALSTDAREYIADTGYATYGDEIYEATLERFNNRVVGTAFLDFEPGDSVLDAVRGQ